MHLNIVTLKVREWRSRHSLFVIKEESVISNQ